jgi:hypothetical protein
MRAVIAALQALRGVAEIAAVTIVAELGRFLALALPGSLWPTAAWSPVKSPAAPRGGKAASPRPETLIFDE